LTDNFWARAVFGFRAEMCHFISEEIEEFLSFALFEKQNAFSPQRWAGVKGCVCALNSAL